MVLVMSIWDDGYSNMLWLDGVKYPLDRDASEPGVPRGECAIDGSSPDQVREKFRDAKVTYSNFKFGPVGSTGGSGTPTDPTDPEPTSTKPTEPQPTNGSGLAKQWEQ